MSPSSASTLSLACDCHAHILGPSATFPYGENRSFTPPDALPADYRKVLDRLGLDWGGTTPDGRLTVEATYCLGLCACAPSAMFDGEPVALLTPQALDDIVREAGR